MGKTTWTVYKKPCVLVVAMDGFLPVFCDLVEILLLREEAHTVIKVCIFSDHYNAYVVLISSDHPIVPHSNLFSYIPLHPRNVKGLTTFNQKAIVMKHHLSSNF